MAMRLASIITWTTKPCTSNKSETTRRISRMTMTTHCARNQLGSLVKLGHVPRPSGSISARNVSRNTFHHACHGSVNNVVANKDRMCSHGIPV